MLIHVVDDNAINCEIFAAIAARLAPDIRVESFTDPLRGIEASRAMLPDLVIVDYMMPVMDGCVYVAELRALPGGKAIPTIMITAATDRTIRYKALELGVTDFLTKPIDRQEVRARLTNLLSLRRMQISLQDRGRLLAEEVRKASVELAHQADHDALTNLPNRHFFNRHLQGLLAGGSAPIHNFALLCVDLDGFKDINDHHGHLAGDAVLVGISRALEASMQPGEVVSRLGGDEFAVIQAGRSQPQAAVELADRIIRAVANVGRTTPGAQTGVSIGIALCPEHGIDRQHLLQQADVALYAAKRDGRGTYRIYTSELDKERRERRALEVDLREAMLLDKLEVHFQPQADAMTGRVVGCEALLRWTHAERGPIPPSTFIPIAEESGLIGELGEWVLRRACLDAASWDKTLRLSVNLSPIQLRPDLPNRIREILAETAFSATRLELEVTEGVFINDVDQVLAVLSELQGMGISVALDDFGTGYSSLGYLLRFSFDRIKIDQSFIAKMNSSNDAGTIVRAMLGLNKNLSVASLAEGVETDQQLEALRREGCEEVQGYLIGRPMGPESFRQYLHHKGRPLITFAEVADGSPPKVLAAAS